GGGEQAPREPQRRGGGGGRGGRPRPAPHRPPPPAATRGRGPGGRGGAGEGAAPEKRRGRLLAGGPRRGPSRTGGLGGGGPALHRAPRAAEDGRHLLLGKIVVVAQDDGAPLRLGERGEETAGVDGRVGRRGRSCADLGLGGIDRLGRRPPMPVAAEIEGDLK